MVLSTGANAALGFIGGLVLLKGLSQEDYGLVSSALAVFLVAQELVGRGINDSMIRLGTEAAAGSVERSNDVFRAGLILKVFFCSIAFAGLMAFPQAIVGLLGRPELADGLPGVMLAILGFGLWSFVLTRRQARLEFGTLAMIQPASNLLRVALLLVFLFLGSLTWTRAIWIISGCLFTSALIVGIGDWIELLFQNWRLRPVLAAVADVWRCGGWNMLAAFAFTAYSRMDIFVLTSQASNSEVATYNAAWQVLTIVDLCNVTIMTVMIPKVCHLIHYEDFVSWTRRTLTLTTAVALLSLPLVLLAGWYIPLLFGVEYTGAVAVARILYWGNTVSLIVFPLVGILYAKRYFHLIAAMHLTLLALSFPAYKWAVGFGGIVGAAWTTVGLRTVASVLLVVAIVWCLRNAPRRALSAAKTGA